MIIKKRAILNGYIFKRPGQLRRVDAENVNQILMMEEWLVLCVIVLEEQQEFLKRIFTGTINTTNKQIKKR